MWANLLPFCVFKLPLTLLLLDVGTDVVEKAGCFPGDGGGRKVNSCWAMSSGSLYMSSGGACFRRSLRSRTTARDSAKNKGSPTPHPKPAIWPDVYMPFSVVEEFEGQLAGVD